MRYRVKGRPEVVVEEALPLLEAARGASSGKLTPLLPTGLLSQGALPAFLPVLLGTSCPASSWALL